MAYWEGTFGGQDVPPSIIKGKTASAGRTHLLRGDQLGVCILVSSIARITMGRRDDGRPTDMRKALLSIS